MFCNVLYSIIKLGVLKYITFRAICAFLCAFVIALCFGKKIINILQQYQKNGQPIRSDGPEAHLQNKKGTPTMGGIIILFSLMASILFWGDMSNAYTISCVAMTLCFGLIGAIDDFLKIFENDSKGLTGKKKLFLQIAISSICLYLCDLESTIVYFPVFKNFQIDFGYIFVLWAVFVIVGSSNAVNLTDGLDGLAMGPVIMSSICLAIISYLVGNSVFAHYLHMEYIPGMSEVSVYLSALIGASLGFMWFNAPPAKIFMGDTGSIAIGGLLGFVSVITKHEILFAIIGGLFVVEAVSVILQVLYFRFTHGKRIFLMAPIHHHFEKKGWAESTIVFRFWILSIVLGIVGLALLKIR
ncbi:MAG: phospho-N-acetylmuramoyl-pentapeptide-transferase [Holosporales bacterium]|jgi:phospho-N-acetylmuramoyl-pentapeptide-transferase|nr:phospho-N-acetylmuramoyl-pentapeptide-transferase [Holosporales bacterium]